MKVLYVDYSIGFGGSFKSLALTFSGLPAVEKVLATAQDDNLVRKWFPETDVCYFRRHVNYRSKGRFESRFPRSLDRRVALKLFAVADTTAFALSTAMLYRLIKRKRIDLVHLNNGFIREGAYAAWMAQVPFLVHMRGFPWPIGDTAGKPDRWLLESAAARSVAAIIGVSKAVTDSVTEVAYNRYTIYDPVDLAVADIAASRRDVIRAEWRLPANAIAIGIFGRVVEWKGQMQFVNAVVGAMRADPRIRGFIVGDQSDGGPEYFDRVREVIRDSGIADRFVLTGYRSNVDDYFAAMDVVVHASISPEPFGMVVPEAMAAGRPVIATDAGGPHEIVSHGVDGLLVTPGDVASMEAAMHRLVADAQLRHQMGGAGRRKAVAMFSIEANARRVQAVYDNVLRGVGKSTGDDTPG